MYCRFDVSALYVNKAGDHNLRLRCQICFRKVEKTVLTSPGRAVVSIFFKVILPPFHQEDLCYLCIVGKSKFYTRSLSLQFHRMLKNPATKRLEHPFGDTSPSKEKSPNVRGHPWPVPY